MPGRLCRRDRRPERPARLRAHAEHPRAAHPPRARDEQHLHEPRPDRARLRHSRQHARAHRLPRTRASCACDKAEYLKSEIRKIPGFSLPLLGTHLQRVRGRVRQGLGRARCCRSSSSAGHPGRRRAWHASTRAQPDQFLVAVTERHSRERSRSPARGPARSLSLSGARADSSGVRARPRARQISPYRRHAGRKLMWAPVLPIFGENGARCYSGA